MTSDSSYTASVFPSLIDSPISWKSTIAFISITSFLIWFGTYTGLGMYPLLGIIGIVVFFYLLRTPYLWLSAVFAGYIPIFWKASFTFTPIEAVHAIIFYGGLAWWFFHRIVIKREPIHWTYGSISYSLAIIMAIAMIPVSLSFSADPFILIREICVMGSMLLFIPMSHELKTQSQRKFVFGLFISMLIGFALKNVALYKQKVLSAVQFWQVGASRESELFYLLFVLSVLAIALMMSSKKRWLRFAWLFVFVISVAACILTFYRTIWLGIAISAVFMGLFLGKVYWRRFVAYGLLAFVVTFIGFEIFLSNAISLPTISTSIAERFLTSKNLGKDRSLRNRTVESEHSLQQSGINLIVGHGLATQIHFINFIEFKPVHTTWSHNAYPWLLYHFGIVGSFLILFSICWFIWKGWKIQQHLKRNAIIDPASIYQIRAFTVAGMAILLVTMIMGWTINPFLDRPTFLAYSVVCAFFEIWNKELIENPVSPSVNTSR